MKSMFSRFVADESGATAIEYGLIAAFIAVAIITTLTSIGSEVQTIFTNVNTGFATANK